MKQKIVIVDYGMGNIFSVAKRFRTAGADVSIAQTHSDILQADKLILPGVGHFGKAMDNLKKKELIAPLNEFVLEHQKPILGICLGMQLMTKSSQEGDSEGLHWFDATVHKFEFKDTLNYKVPHIGWNSVQINHPHPLMKGVAAEDLFYFVHSYYVRATEKDALNSTLYHDSFTSAIAKDHIMGVQYHPEKSHDSGMKLLTNFIQL